MTHDQCSIERILFVGDWSSDDWSLAIGKAHQPPTAKTRFVIGHWSFFGHWSLVIGHCIRLSLCLLAALLTGCHTEETHTEARSAPQVQGDKLTFPADSPQMAALVVEPVEPCKGSAIRLNGGNYTYLLQVSGTTLGLIGAAATLLDSVATSAVSAATTASYLRGEFTSFPMAESVVTIVVLCGLSSICLFNVRSSSTLTLSFFIIHVCGLCQRF